MNLIRGGGGGMIEMHILGAQPTVTDRHMDGLINGQHELNKGRNGFAVLNEFGILFAYLTAAMCLRMSTSICKDSISSARKE